MTIKQVDLLLQHELWHRGDLEFLTFKRPHGQNHLYNFVHTYKDKCPDSTKPIILNCHRRLGKTYLALLLLIERCLRAPGTIAKFGAPYYIQVGSIVRPLLAEILMTCPSSLRPVKSGDTYTFHNARWGTGAKPSTLSLIGCNIDEGDRLRGTATDVVALDEVRDVPNLKYIIDEVLSYQFVGRKRPTLILTTTPPASTAHDFCTKFIPMAMAAGTYKVMPVSTNKDFTKRDEQVILDIVGSKESIGWRREAECELIDDPDKLVVSDFSDDLVEEFDLPKYYVPLVAIDTGYNPDYTALLFGTVDFRKGQLQVIDEIVIRCKTTGELINQAKAMEDKYFLGCQHSIVRYADANKQQLADFDRDWKYYVQAAEKWDKLRWINELNHNMRQKKIKIHSRCAQLVYQCKHATWDPNKKVNHEFIRNDALGHCDALAALVYMNRMAPWMINPYPAGIVDKSVNWVNPKDKVAGLFGSI